MGDPAPAVNPGKRPLCRHVLLFLVEYIMMLVIPVVPIAAIPGMEA
jgi:hypothetical protein